MNLYVPDVYQKSIYTINYNKLKTQGIKCLVFDLDNTIEPYKELEPSKKLTELMTFLKDDFKIVIMSNNNKERVRPFKENLNVDAAHSSKKPLKNKYKKILSMYNFEPNEVACIGDQIMTDVFGANRMGMISILVHQISPIEPLGTKFNRFFERIIVKRLNKKGCLIKGEFYE